MNQMKTVSCIAFVSMALGGCAPLQQAPLVYSSKVSVGVDISATTTETPGVALNVGYKQVDAAYVPVAVAKKCESTNSADCKDDAYKIVKLNSESDQQDVVAPSESAIAAANAEVARTAASVADKTVALDQATKAYDTDKKLSDDLVSLKAKFTELSKSKDANDPDLRGLQQSIDQAQDASNRLNSRRAAITAATSVRDAAISEAAKAYSSYQALVEKKSANRNGRHDAYSVFGTFEGNVRGAGDKDLKVGADVKVGKVFSTGVASQNLTEGMKANYAAAGLVSCIQSADTLVNKMADGAEKQKAISDLIGLCVKHGMTIK